MFTEKIGERQSALHAFFMERAMGNIEIDESSEASLVKGDFGVAVAYFGLAMCMLAAIYAASTSPGTAIGDFASMAVLP
jgi:hypothetical protein